MSSIHDYDNDKLFNKNLNVYLLESARNCSPPPVPIPVADGFPEPEPKDCDEKGRVWAIGELEIWVRVERSKIKALGWKAWLPAYALPTLTESSSPD